MANIDIDCNPDIKPDDIIKILNKKYGEKYKIYPSKLIGLDIVVRKSAYIGTGIRLIKRGKSIQLKILQISPDAFARVLSASLIGFFMFRKPMRDLENEITAYMLECPELKKHNTSII